MESSKAKMTNVSFAAATGTEGRAAAKAARAPPATAAEASAAAAAGAATPAAAAAAASDEEPSAGQQVVGLQMLCEGVLSMAPSRPPVATPAAATAAGEAAEAAEAAAALAAVTPADFKRVKSLQLSNRNLVKLSNLGMFKVRAEAQTELQQPAAGGDRERQPETHRQIQQAPAKATRHTGRDAQQPAVNGQKEAD
ncbi:hypothetical protein Efla_005078 [Eimeria flavescens]